MLLEKFSNLIERSPIGAAIDFRQKLIEQTDPNRIYVENIRSFFHVPTAMAQWLCNEAVKQGIFEKRIGFMCPRHQSIIGDFPDAEKATQMTCEACQALDEEKYTYSPSDCQCITFYRLVKDG